MVGLVGFEPTTFTRCKAHLTSTGFFKLQNLIIPMMGLQTRICILEPVVMPFQQPPLGQAAARLQPLKDFLITSQNI